MNIDELTSLAKRLGFFWPSAELYGGEAGFYDYGHVGALLKRRFEEVWTRYFVDYNNYYMIEGSNILPEQPLVASGHAAHFNDVLVSCTKCKTYYRADVLLRDLGITVSEGAKAKEIDDAIKKNKATCPKCKGQFANAKDFNMMFGLGLGPEKAERAYLRPETAQSAYLNFSREFMLLRGALPMGLAIIGKAYRNEIAPRQGLYRMRELVQAELQIFFDPESWKPELGKLASRRVNVLMYGKEKEEKITVKEFTEKYSIPEFYAYHLALIDIFYKDVIGLDPERLRFREKGGDEKAFYNKIHMDIEVNVDSWRGFSEVGGLHYRTDYDLSSHSKGSKQDLSVNVNGKKIVPHVLELSFGVDRNLWMLLDMFYKKIEERAVLQLPNYLAPFNAAVFALQHDDKLEKIADEVSAELRNSFKIFSDRSGSIGRRYARMDEVGTPFCITVDFDTVDEKSRDHGTVTVRERDSKKQVRIKTGELDNFLRGELAFSPEKYLKV